MRIAFATSYDPHDVLAWSGTGYYAARSLQEQGAKLTFTGPMAPPYPFLGRAKRSFYRRVLARHYRADRDPLVLRYYARTVAAHLRDAKADVVLSLEGTLPIAYLECPQPLAFWGDATFAAMVDYYPGFTRLCTETRKGGHKADRLAINKSCACLYSNEWAAASALRDYGADPARVQVVPFGANIDSSLTNADLEAVLANRPTTRCNLLFLGASWERKGGDTALAVVEELNKAGLPTHLTIIGAQPRAGLVLPRYATALGFISKRTPQGMGKLVSLLAASHYLILPTRAECCAAVLAEASAWAVPSLVARTGGVGTAVRDGVNGQCFPADATPSAYAEFVETCFRQYDRYRELARSSLAEYYERLNWTVAARQVLALLREI